MKKILFATTALIATAGMAAAEVRLSGYGRFGLDYNDANDGRRIDTDGNGVVDTVLSSTSITSRMRIQFDMSTESDSGVEFGGRLRLQTESRDNSVGGGAANGTTTANGARFYASYGGFTLQVGNIAGAIDSMPGLYLPTSSADTGIDGMGFNALVALNGYDAYSSNGTGSNGFEVIYSSGSFGAHVSYSQARDPTTGPAPAPVADGARRIAATVSYSFGDWTAALGVNDSNAVNTGDMVIATLTGDLGQFGVGLAFAQNEIAANNDATKIRIYGTMDIGSAGTLLLWVTNTSYDLANPNDGTNFGINYSHDLGGGVSFDAGFVDTAANQTQAQAGVYFRF